MKPFLNTAIIGNGRMLATLDSAGQLHRLFWPGIDFAQNINSSWAAIYSPVLGDEAVRLDDTDKWNHKQQYASDSCILRTEAAAYNADIQIDTFDFVAVDRDILVRRFEVKNCSADQMTAVLLYYNSFHIDESSLFNTVIFDNETDVMLHYRRDKWFAVGGSPAVSSYQCGGYYQELPSGRLNGNDNAMSPEGCQTWDLEVIEPGEVKRVTVFFAAGRNRAEALENLLYARGYGWDKFLQETEAFWETYFRKGYQLDSSDKEIPRLFKRSVMVCKLLMNRDTGGIIAAPEFDEKFSRCGGYGYCWGRDGVYIAHAMLKAGYPEYARDFYRWAARSQETSGGWPQRQYTDGSLAPVWGSQIDETGTILWGIYQYCKETWDMELLEELWPTISKAAGFLLDSLSPDNQLPSLTFDLWEERFGEHAYSSAAVYAGLKGAGLLAKAFHEPELAAEWLETAKTLQQKIIEYFWDEELKRFIRSGWVRVDYAVYLKRKQAGVPVKEVTNSKGYTHYLVFGDSVPDASLLGLAVPFGLISPDDGRMKKTVDNLVEALTNTNTGGIGRYFGDCYAGGNPWVLITLWAGLYEGIVGQWDKALARLKWTLDHQTNLGLLPEQVDCETGEPAWVVPLAWSHAMFISLAVMLSDAQKL